MNRLPSLSRIATALAVIASAALITTIAVRGQGQAAPKFEGTWRVEVLIPNVPPIAGLHTYTAGGTMMEVSTASSFIRFGVWERIGDRTLALTREALINNPNVPQVKRVRTREVIELSQDFTSFTGVGEVLFFGAAGQRVPSPTTGLPSDCARIRGTRMQIEAPECP